MLSIIIIATILAIASVMFGCLYPYILDTSRGPSLPLTAADFLACVMEYTERKDRDTLMSVSPPSDTDIDDMFDAYNARRAYVNACDTCGCHDFAICECPLSDDTMAGDHLAPTYDATEHGTCDYCAIRTSEDNLTTDCHGLTRCYPPCVPTYTDTTYASDRDIAATYGYHLA